MSPQVLAKASFTSCGARELISWGRLQHLRTRFAANLLADKHDGDLLRVLHPSAAVLGYPRPAAWQALPIMESFERGWYAGPIGWIGRDASEFAVGIRSALLRQRNLSLYAGAGIVKESQPQREWQEVRDKMQPYLDLFGIE